jgi:hypothetical protein
MPIVVSPNYDGCFRIYLLFQHLHHSNLIPIGFDINKIRLIIGLEIISIEILLSEKIVKLESHIILSKVYTSYWIQLSYKFKLNFYKPQLNLE